MKATLPLQAADTIATENYWHALQFIAKAEETPARAHYRHFLANAPAQAFMLGREELIAELARREAENGL